MSRLKHKVFYCFLCFALFISLRLSSITYCDQTTLPTLYQPLANLSDGEITTIVGRVLADNSPATKARFIPYSVVVDKDNNIFFADNEHNRVRRIDSKTAVITTVAGGGAFCEGSTCENIPATEIAISTIQDIAIDDQGNLFIAEAYSRSNSNLRDNRVSRVEAKTGLISTIVGGEGFRGLTNGKPAQQMAVIPTSIAVDKMGNLFIADFNSRSIVQVNSNGFVHIVAGNGQLANCEPDGEAVEIAIGYVADIVVDSKNNLFFSQLGEELIRYLDLKTGLLSTIAGDCDNLFSGDGGLATKASLNSPTSLFLDKAGNLFITDTNNMRIRRIDGATGIINTVAGDGFKDYIPFDGHTYTVGRFAGDGGLATDASLFFPLGVAVDSDGNILISDTSNKCIRRVDANTKTINSIGGKGIEPNTKDIDVFDYDLYANAFTLDSKANIVTTNFYGHRVELIEASTGKFKPLAGLGAATSNGTGDFSGDGGLAIEAYLNEPSDVALDARGNIFIADSRNNRVRKIKTATGIINTVVGNGKEDFCGDGGLAKKACLNNLGALALDSKGNIFIVDSGNNRIRKVDANTNIITTIAGTGEQEFAGDGGLAINASFSFISDIKIDSFDNIFVIELSRVRRIDARTGIINTVAGGGSFDNGLGDGLLATEVAFGPSGIAIDQKGNLFISDPRHHRVRRVDAETKIITTVAGNDRGGYSGDNTNALKASLNSPGTLAIDKEGNLFILDHPGIRVVKRIANKD